MITSAIEKAESDRRNGIIVCRYKSGIDKAMCGTGVH